MMFHRKSCPMLFVAGGGREGRGGEGGKGGQLITTDYSIQSQGRYFQQRKYNFNFWNEYFMTTATYCFG